VDLIGRLFAVEKQAKDMSVAERLALRQTRLVPVLAELWGKLLAWKEQLRPKHLMAEAAN
jgi:Transposase IS66 family